MTDYTKIVLESDSRGRISINALDDNGLGHGHRLAGPKYCGDLNAGDLIAKVILDGSDIDGLREYSNIWDRIHLDESAEVHALNDSLRRYLSDRASAAKYPEYQHLPHNQERADETRRNLLAACAALINEFDTGTQAVDRVQPSDAQIVELRRNKRR